MTTNVRVMYAIMLSLSTPVGVCRRQHFGVSLYVCGPLGRSSHRDQHIVTNPKTAIKS